MSVEKRQQGAPPKKEREQSEPVAVCIFERPQKVKVKTSLDERFKDGYVDARLSKDSPTVQRSIKTTATQGGREIHFKDSGFLGWHGVPPGSRTRNG